MKDLFNKDGDKAAEGKNSVRTPSEPAVSTAQHDEGMAPAPRALLDLQRSHGNRFVVEMLDQHPAAGVRNSSGSQAEVGLHPATGGEPLNPQTRTAMESRFGQDFGQVRVHTDDGAARAAGKLQAQAFTFGSDIFFGAGRYRGGHDDPLLAHELAHVTQQQPGAGAAGAGDAELEAQAEQAEGRGPAGAAARGLAAPGPRVQRKADDATQAPPAHAHHESFFERIGKGIASAGKAVWHGMEAVGSAAWKGIKAVGHGIATAAEAVWTGIQWVGRQLWDKVTAIFGRAEQWVARLPERLKRLVMGLWEGVKSLHPWSLKWWESLGHASTWGDFLKWLGRSALQLAELLGIPEIAETLSDLVKFNTRALSGAERGKAASVFGGSINLDLVRIDEAGFIGPSWTKREYTTFHTINGWGGIADDTLIHELTHVWQYERSGAIYMAQAVHAQLKLGGRGAYDYKGLSGLQAAKNAGRGILSFNREQQAQIVQDFYRLKTGLSAEFAPAATTADLPLYAHFVKDVSTLSAAQLVV